MEVYPSKITTNNTELNDLRLIICFRESEVFVDRISVLFYREKNSISILLSF